MDEASINLSKIEPIPAKNTISTINQFLFNTSRFLNKFALNSEERINTIDQEVDKIETLIMLLEKKLDSIPQEYFNSVPQAQQTNLPQQPQFQQQQQQDVPQQQVNNGQTGQPPVQVETPAQQIPVEEPKEEEKPPELDDNMKKYIRMFNMGIPVPAVKIKMKTEGYDPSLLDPHIVEKK